MPPTLDRPARTRSPVPLISPHPSPSHPLMRSCKTLPLDCPSIPRRRLPRSTHAMPSAGSDTTPRLQSPPPPPTRSSPTREIPNQQRRSPLPPLRGICLLDALRSAANSPRAPPSLCIGARLWSGRAIVGPPLRVLLPSPSFCTAQHTPTDTAQRSKPPSEGRSRLFPPKRALSTPNSLHLGQASRTCGEMPPCLPEMKQSLSNGRRRAVAHYQSLAATLILHPTMQPSEGRGRDAKNLPSSSSSSSPCAPVAGPHYGWAGGDAGATQEEGGGGARGKGGREGGRRRSTARRQRRQLGRDNAPRGQGRRGQG